MSDLERPAIPVVAAPDEVITVLEETVRVDKRLVESRARVHVTVSEHEETVEALLMRQDIAIERVPVGRTVETTPPVRKDGDTVIVPVMEEILVVEKRLVLKEELHIRIDATRHTETQVVSLRREHAEITNSERSEP